MSGAGVRQMLEVARGKGMQDREREQRGAGNLERTDGGGHGARLSRRPQDEIRNNAYVELRTCPANASPRNHANPLMKPLRYLRDAAVFAPCYVLLDWVSYIHPLGPFNITPWNPQPALAIAWMLLGGLVHAPAVLATVFLADVVVRNVPGGYLRRGAVGAHA